MGNGRFRDGGFAIGRLPTGACNTICDVPGVKVAHVTLREASGCHPDVCTGVTAILPHSGNLFEEKVLATAHVINGFGKTAGLVQVAELGEIESPIMLTNTFSVGAVLEGTLQQMMAQNVDIGDGKSSLNIVVGECNDSFLNDMRGLHVRPEHAVEAIERALASDGGSVEEGGVGAGAGMRCFGWKGGIGTSSRQVRAFAGQSCHHVGVLALTNFGVPEDLTILGCPVGQALSSADEGSGIRFGGAQCDVNTSDLSDGSVMIILATDLPVDLQELVRIAKRATFGLARVGSIAHHGSGDIVIAFSTTGAKSNPEDRLIREWLRDGANLSDCFRAVVEATEEAILNSLWAASTTVGKRSRVVRALPVHEVEAMLRGSSD
ncbi:P1 family peptidase [Alicyclobacillus fastidiosus]|uniref:P1 family peptidase n=1 Tax=Alicyclobacillus fastidiosus TaxID=392011 RepID=A0ABV5A940_9BACL|nr:P1 family peptidase [Alicyclobacillus fastidiosus]WEH10725.1 P1 family peptidase [Alicyclobacillus fastidiosus]